MTDEPTGADEPTDMPVKPEQRVIALVLAVIAIGALGFAAFSSSWLYAERTQLQLHEDGKMPLTVGPVHEAAFSLRGFEKCVARDDVTSCETMSNGELMTAWNRELLVARYLAGEPVDAEAKAALGEPELAKLVRRRAMLRRAFEDPAQALAEGQRDLLIAKRVYATSPVFPVLGWITFFACLIAAASLAIATGIVVAGKRIRLPIMPTTTALLGVLIALGTGCVYLALKPGPPGYVGVGVGFFVFGGGVVLGLYSSLVLNKLMRPHDPDLLEDAMNADEF